MTKIAFIFPGQASQHLKMMDTLSDFSIVKKIFDEAQEILDVDFWNMLQEDTANNINKTINTQPLMLISGYATYCAWKEYGKHTPSILAGHSLGEWTALVAGGVITFADALKLVKLRAELMQNAVSIDTGAMAAVLGMDIQKISDVCKKITSKNNIVEVSNINSPKQVVISGHKTAIETAILLLKEHGAKRVQLLPVSIPSHCTLMIEASQSLEIALNNTNFSIPKIPIIHNYDAKSYNDINSIKTALVKQLYSPVLWIDVINQITMNNIFNIIECGPGKVLSGLNKYINSDIISYNLHNTQEFQQLYNLMNKE